ncbi:hypothetical protein JXA84_00430, partial [candidate division WOR-3 bacterium]|nr:hypothetical protein [candidate division WOR-3 bacterium]
MKNCPFTSTPGEPKFCSPDCVFYNTERGDCGLLEVVNTLKDIKEKSAELRDSLFDINSTWKQAQENLKDLKPDVNISEKISSVESNINHASEKIKESIDLIPQKIENYRSTSETLIELVKKSNSLLDQLKQPKESPELAEMIELLKGSVLKLTEIKDRINIESAFKEFEKSEKDFFDTLAVDLNNSIEKNQALLIENLSSYLTTASQNLEKIITEPNYTKILDYLKKIQEENISTGEKFVRSLEETLGKNQKDLISSFDGYFSTLKEEISTLPSSVGEIENFIKTN